MPTYEGLRLKVLKYDRKLFGNYHQKDLKNKQFTIISNNCWGGLVYEYYNLQKQSPTVGLFFMADDYIRFVSSLHEYLSAELEFLNPEESKWKEYWDGKDSRFGSYPIGRLNLRRGGAETVEIFFLHYHSDEEARANWERRCERINWNKLIVKFNDQNGCTEEHIKRFIGLDFKHKAFFTCKRWDGVDYSAPGLWYEEISQFPRHEQIIASFEPFNRKVTLLINSLYMRE